MNRTTARAILFAVGVALTVLPLAAATPSPDVMAPIRQFIDGFNKGDTKSAFAAYAAGDISIIDEFAPHLWTGPNAAHAWAAEYDKHAAAAGVSDGSVTYRAPTRKEIEGDLAYVIVPTVYLYKEHGRAMAEEGQIAVVLHMEGGGWKMRAWTWSGVKPHLRK
jgi:hypothetical protein